MIPGEPNSLSLEDLANPVIKKDNELLIKTIEVGIDGTDLDIIKGIHGEPPPDSKKIILGHEALGKVLESGAGVKKFVTGDLVVPTVRRPCGIASCIPCRKSESDMCMTGGYLERGIKGLNGFLSEYFVEEEDYLVKIPSSIADVAVLMEPLSICIKTFTIIDKIQKRLSWGAEKTLILGAGPLGILFTLLMKSKGYDTVVLSRNSEHSSKAELIRLIGARYYSTISAASADIKNREGGFDIIIEATGAYEMVLKSFEYLKKNGILALTGIYNTSHQLQLNFGKVLLDLVLDNKVVFGAVNSNINHFRETVSKTLKNYSQWKEILHKITADKIKLVDFPEIVSKKSNFIKKIITFK